MSYPLVPEKYKRLSLVSPEQLVKSEEKNTLPPRAVLCFSNSVARSLKKTKFFENTIYKAGFTIDLYKKENGKKEVGVVSDVGVGASAGVLCLEQLRVLGVKEFISVGMVGSLNPDLKIGEKVLIVKAFRDEGCSYHYKAPSSYIELPRNKLDIFEKMNLKSVAGWTTDAPYRETKEEVLYFQSKGVECVEMEASALMTVGEYYGLDVFCTGVVSDHLSSRGWTPQFSHPDVKKNFSELLSEVLFL